MTPTVPRSLLFVNSRFLERPQRRSRRNHLRLDMVHYLSMLTKRIVLARLNDYLSSNPLLNPHQYGFTKHNSTETMLVSLYNKLVSAVSHKRIFCLCILDISAAFDTIDHITILQRLSSWFGVSGTALLWFQSSVKACSHALISTRPTLLWCPSRLRPGPTPFHPVGQPINLRATKGEGGTHP